MSGLPKVLGYRVLGADLGFRVEASLNSCQTCHLKP